MVGFRYGVRTPQHFLSPSSTLLAAPSSAASSQQQQAPLLLQCHSTPLAAISDALNPAARSCRGCWYLICCSKTQLRAALQHDEVYIQQQQQQQQELGDDEGFVSVKSEDSPTHVWSSFEAQLQQQQQQNQQQQQQQQRHRGSSQQQLQLYKPYRHGQQQRQQQTDGSGVSAALSRCGSLDALLQLLHRIAADEPLQQQQPAVLLRALQQLAAVAADSRRDSRRDSPTMQKRVHHVARYPIVKVRPAAAAAAQEQQQQLLLLLLPCNKSQKISFSISSR